MVDIERLFKRVLKDHNDGINGDDEEVRQGSARGVNPISAEETKNEAGGDQAH